MKKILFLSLVVLMVTACGNDDESNLTLDTGKISLYTDDTEKITASEYVTWESDNEFVATVSNNGIVTGEHIGKAIIIATSANGEAKCEVEVKAKYNTFTEPILDFSASKSTIKSKEKRELLREDETILTYKPDKGPIQGVAYFFENGKMKTAGVFVNLSSSRETINFLLERYMLVTTGSGNMVGIMLNNIPDLATMSVSIWVEDMYALVMYTAYDRMKKRSAVEEGIMIDKMKELFNRLK